jgi:hypothetical protein
VQLLVQLPLLLVQRQLQLLSFLPLLLVLQQLLGLR